MSMSGAEVVPYDAVMARLAERLRQLRKARGLTLEAAGQRAGMSRSTWYQYESGDRPNPTIKVLAGMARALDVEPFELLRGVDEYPGDDDTGRRATGED